VVTKGNASAQRYERETWKSGLGGAISGRMVNVTEERAESFGGRPDDEGGARFAAIPRHPAAAGMLLVALPALTDPNFAGSVIFLLESDPEGGSAGLIINSPTRTPVGSVLPDWHDMMSEPMVVFRGGPVQTDGALCLGRLDRNDPVLPPPGIRVIRHPAGAERVALIDLDREPEEIAPAVTGLRVFAGHAGWSPGQLEDEIEQEAWLVVPGWAGAAFHTDAGGLWRRVLRHQPAPLSFLSTISSDPTLN
jgi:putative transcriptional regulator